MTSIEQATATKHAQTHSDQRYKDHFCGLIDSTATATAAAAAAAASVPTAEFTC